MPKSIATIANAQDALTVEEFDTEDGGKWFKIVDSNGETATPVMYGTRAAAEVRRDNLTGLCETAPGGEW